MGRSSSSVCGVTQLSLTVPIAGMGYAIALHSPRRHNALLLPCPRAQQVGSGGRKRPPPQEDDGEDSDGDDSDSEDGGNSSSEDDLESKEDMPLPGALWL